jgi:hypothetical protein
MLRWKNPPLLSLLTVTLLLGALAGDQVAIGSPGSQPRDFRGTIAAQDTPSPLSPDGETVPSPDTASDPCNLGADSVHGRSVVILRDRTDNVGEVAEDLVRRYGLAIRSLLPCSQAFTADMPLETIWPVARDTRVRQRCPNTNFPRTCIPTRRDGEPEGSA